MIAAGFSGGEAEELRRAFGFKRSEARMKDVETKLREGMARTGITGAAQDEIVHAITSFALYGFPESHAASFALLAYASAYLKCHYLAAFTAAMLNNQPMGFYHPASLVKDAQRHGLLIKPIDVTRSDWLCTLEPIDSQPSHGDAEKHQLNGSSMSPCLRCEKHFALRIGLRYVRGLREEAGRALVAERAQASFASIDDLARRVPALRKDELETLAAIGALNNLNHEKRENRTDSPRFHRRDALWQVALASRPRPLLLHNFSEPDASSPLTPMDTEERLVADYHGTGMTVGPHPMSYRRAQMNELGVIPANRLATERSGKKVRVAGCVICRQRPGTAKGFVFLSLEDETGIANAIVTPDLYDEYRFLLGSERFLLVEGTLQHQDNVISVKADKLLPLHVTAAATSSHDFH
jgi:error-prone DNA polymerase